MGTDVKGLPIICDRLDWSKQVSRIQRILVCVGETYACCLSARVSTCSRMRLSARMYTTCSPYVYFFATIYRYILYLDILKWDGASTLARLVIEVARCVARARSPLVLTPAPYVPAVPVTVPHGRLSWREHWRTSGSD